MVPRAARQLAVAQAQQLLFAWCEMLFNFWLDCDATGVDNSWRIWMQAADVGRLGSGSVRRAAAACGGLPNA